MLGNFNALEMLHAMSKRGHFYPILRDQLIAFLSYCVYATSVLQFWIWFTPDVLVWKDISETPTPLGKPVAHLAQFSGTLLPNPLSVSKQMKQNPHIIRLDLELNKYSLAFCIILLCLEA